MIRSLLLLAILPLLAVAEKPNIVIIMTDDQGWADVGINGAKGFKTPHLDQMAEEGIHFTHWYVPQAVCGASRAGLLTGCYPNRIGMLGAPGPGSKRGIHDDEVLIPEMLKQEGYATALFGKWHLGDRKEFLPLQHGFDEYFGLPYSNDMWPHHPGVRHLPLEERIKKWPHLPLIEGNEIINPEVSAEDQTSLTTRYTEKAVDFIKRKKDGPFFLYVAHSMPHVPLYVSDKFKGKSEQGLYGDVIMEIDWSVGQILKTLKAEGLDNNTVVLFTSDNGPWLSYGNHAGSTGPLREGKGTAWEGGQRVPCIARWPERIQPGSVCHEPAMHIDLFPTIAAMLNSELPAHGVDGKDIGTLFTAPDKSKSPHEAYYFYYNDKLCFVRSESWTLAMPHEYRTLKGEPGNGGIPGPYQQTKTGLALYNLKTDPGQQTDVSKQHPDVVARLKKSGETFDKDLRANRRQPGKAK